MSTSSVKLRYVIGVTIGMFFVVAMSRFGFDANILVFPTEVTQREFSNTALSQYWFRGVKFTGAVPIPLPVENLGVVPGSPPILVRLLIPSANQIALPSSFYGVIRPVDAEVLARAREGISRAKMNFNSSYPDIANVSPVMIFALDQAGFATVLVALLSASFAAFIFAVRFLGRLGRVKPSRNVSGEP